MAEKILILQGHPDGANPHFCHALADAYRKGAEASGHSVEVIDTGRQDLAPLRDPAEWKSPPALPWVDAAQAAILRADHLVLVYPLWMGTLPAHLKAWFERVFSETFAFEITDKGWRAKLKGRSARVVVTMGMPALVYRFYFFAHSLKSLRRNMLGFAGFQPVRSTLIGMVENARSRERALKRLEDLGRKAG